MSDYRALAAATVTLRNLLSDAIRVMPGARVRMGPPQELPSHEVADGLVSLFLYRVQPNATWRNEELPFRRADGSLARKPQLAVDAHFLVSFYGDDERQVANRLLGLTLAAVHTHAYPPIQFIPGAETSEDEALASGVDRLLAGSGLEHQRHALYFTPQPMSHDELTKLWAIFAHIPYVPSIAYVGTVLLIETLDDAVPELPVARTAFAINEASAPSITQVSPGLVAASSSARIVLQGSDLDAKGLRARFDRDIEIEPTRASATEAEFRLPAELMPGARVVDVVVPAARGAGVWISEPLSFLLQPTLLAVVVDPAGGTSAGSTSAGGDRPMLDVRFAPAPRIAQQARILLYARDRHAAPRSADPVASDTGAEQGSGRRAWAFDLTVDPQAGGALRVEVPVDPGSYLVRLEIGGVGSPLVVETDPESPRYGTFIGPTVSVP